MLDKTIYTQAALYVVNALSYYQKIEETGRKPDFVAGHSVGEYNALLAAETFDFETGLLLVQKRAMLMNRVSDGAMAAIIGLDIEIVQSIINEAYSSQLAIANSNSKTQVVISGDKNVIRAIEKRCLAAGAKALIPLRVSGTFHSFYMKEAQNEFSLFLQGYSLRAPKIPVVSNVTAQPYTVSNLYNNLTQQITATVMWYESIQYLLEQNETNFEELGPGTVLTGLINKIKRKM